MRSLASDATRENLCSCRRRGASVIAGLDVICAPFVITSWIVGFLVLAGSISLLWRSRGRRRAALRWIAATVAGLVVVIFAAGVSVNAYYAYLPTLGDVGQAATGDRQWVNIDTLDR